MPTEQEIRDVAKRAAEVLRQRGWHQGDYFDTDEADHDEDGIHYTGGPVCMLGALNVAARPREHNPARDMPEDLYEVINPRLLTLIGAEYADVPDYNDRAARTADEVIAVLERVAAGEGATP